MVERAGREILERLKQLEQTLSFTSDDLYEDPSMGRSIFDAARDAVIITNERMQIVLANPAAQEMFDRTNLIGHNIDELIPAVQEPVLRTFPELDALKSDGTTFTVSVNTSPITSHQGTLIMSVIREKGLYGA